LAWGWRIPFYLSGLLIVIGLLIRLRILETPLFAALQKQEKIAAMPIRETLRHHWREVLLAAGARIAENACFYLFSVWVLTYGVRVLHVERGLLLQAVNVAAALELITIPLYGFLSDRWSRRGAYVAGCVCFILFAFPYFWLLETRNPVAIFCA